jgi:hypothetical protein
MRLRIYVVAASIAATTLVSGCTVRATAPAVVVRGPEVIVTRPPPPLRVEEVPPPPSPSYAWQPGHWHWNGADYVWKPGHYVERPYAAAHWVPPQWVERNGQWVFHAGHWAG